MRHALVHNDLQGVVACVVTSHIGSN
jgi:hypothetical protein